jgi:hypothetical protein
MASVLIVSSLSDLRNAINPVVFTPDRVLARIAGVPTFFATKFKQIMPFCIISWSDSKLF